MKGKALLKAVSVLLTGLMIVTVKPAQAFAADNKIKNPDLHTVFKILIKTGIFSAYIDDLESSIYQIRAIQQ